MKLEFEISAAEADFLDTEGGDFASPDESPADKLRAGIEAARAGERERAKILLLEASQIEPRSEEVWMWLAEVSEYPEELLGFLERALNLNPNNERALQWALETKSLLSKTFVERGANLLVVGATGGNQNAFARQCFKRAVLHDDENEAAWLHLAKTADTDEEKQTYLKKVLSLNAENAAAADALATPNKQEREYESPSYYEVDDDVLSLERPVSCDYLAEQQQIAEIERQASIHSSMPRNKTILIVDDSATVRRLISGKLEKSGHAVICAVDGVDALEKIETVVPDLILLDISMPRMDGYQVCKLIRTNEKTRDVPIIMISGKDGFIDKVRGRMAGTTGYITKPFGPETLMETVKNYIV